MKHNFANVPGNLPVGSESPHFRRGSTHSAHSDMGNHAPNHPGAPIVAGAHGSHNNHGGHGHNNHGHHGGPGLNRAGYPPNANRGRGNYNNHYNNQGVQYQPPNGPYPPRGPSAQGRNGMAAQFQPRNVMQPNFSSNSPQTVAARISPAIPPAVPNNGTPQMQAALPVNAQTAPPFMPLQYQNQTGFPPHPNVNTAPFPSLSNYPDLVDQHGHQGPPTSYRGGNRKKGARGVGDRLSTQPPRAFDSASKCSGPQQQEFKKGKYRRNSKRWTETEQSKEPGAPDQQLASAPSGGSLSAATDFSGPSMGHGLPPPAAADDPSVLLPLQQGPVPSFQRKRAAGDRPLDDLSPASGNFDRLLTKRIQNYPAPYGQGYAVQQGMMGFPTYSPMNAYGGNAPQPQGYGYGYGQPFAVPGAAQPMSRTSSQAASERPNSSTGQVQTPISSQASLVPPGTTAGAAPKALSATAPQFVKATKKAITIKTPQGETLDFKKAPASSGPDTPASSRTPPVNISQTPPPPPKSVAPSQGKTESIAISKTAEQVRTEFMDKVRMTAETPADTDAKVKTEAKPGEKKASEPVVIVTSAPQDEKPAEKPAVKPAEKPVEKPAAETAQPAEEEKPAAATTVALSKAADEKKAPAEAKKEEPAKTEAPAAAAAEPPLDDDEEMERIIREMEEEEARREAEEAAYEATKKQRDEEAKKKSETDRLANAAENDRKLREQEREMERLEEERERKREESEAAAASGGKVKSVTEVLAEKISDITLGERKESSAAAATPDSLANKLDDLTLTDRAKPALSPSSETAAAAAKQQRAKPSALNLTPLNTKSVEPPQPSAALQSLKTARFLRDPTAIAYPKGIQSPNPALNPAVNKKGNFKYDMGFLLQFKDVFTEKPSLDFDQQVKQLIGDGESAPRSGTRTPAGTGGARQNSRTTASAAFNTGFMGNFNSGSNPLPPGTTSEQRFAMASGSIPRPPVSTMPTFGRPGGFPGAPSMTRTPSSTIGGGMPNSPRQSSRSTRGNSRQNHNTKADAQAAKTMPLTHGQELKPIAVSAAGWKPTSIGNRGAMGAAGPTPAGVALDPGMVQRKVKAALNKMTPEKFDKISDQILTIAMQSKDEEDGRTLRQVIQLTFEKATDEAHWAPMYAKFCKRMLDMMSPEIRDVTIKDKKGDVISGGTLFRKYLLNRCQEEFERGWKIDLPQPKEGESREAIMLSDEYYEAAAAKRRGLGLVQFIGELYKLGMLTERIMHECVRKLVDYETMPDEAEIESLSKLLRTVGANLDSTDKGRPMMDAYFIRIKNIIDIPDLPSRLKFMLMDIIDLRQRHWASDEALKVPKTLEEVRQEAEALAAQKAAETARSSSQRGGGGRQGMGRGDSRQFSYNQPAPNQVGMDDLRRLKGSASRIASSSVTMLGPTSMFASRSNSGRRNGPGGSFGRTGDDSGPASRVGTPPTRTDSNSVSHTNAFE